MRLKITLHHNENVFLPWDYQYAVQSWIYHTLAKADAEVTTKLHDIGFPYDKKHFKLFGFGRWESLPNTKKDRQGMVLHSGTSTIKVSFLLPDILSTFVSGLFIDLQYTFYFPNKKLIATQVVGAEILPIPDFSLKDITYRLVTGARISMNNPERKHGDYIGPEHREYKNRWIQNIYHKYLSSIKEDTYAINIDEIKCEIIGEGKSKMMNMTKNGIIHKSRVFVYDFMVSAPEEIHKTLYFAGVGEECSIGMGWVEKV